MPVSLLEYYGMVDWLEARPEDIENTSIRDDVNELADEGPGSSVLEEPADQEVVGSASAF